MPDWLSLPRTERALGGWVALAAALTLGAALALEALLGLAPCSLCSYQRWACVLALLSAATAATTRGGAGTSAALVAIAGLSFAAGGAVAGFHVGVEHGWWASPSTCAGELVVGADLARLQNPAAAPPCDVVQWRALGVFSLAELNAVASPALAALTGWGLWRVRRG